MIENRYKKKFSKFSIENPEVWGVSQIKHSRDDVNFLHKLFKKFGKVNSVLDIGCAIGSHVDEFRKKGYAAFGTDANPEMINYAKKKYPLSNFETQDMRKLNLKEKYGGIVCIAGVIHFCVTNDQVLNTLKKFYNQLKKGGILLIEFTSWLKYIEGANFKGKFIAKGKDVKQYGVYEVITDKINARKQTAINERVYYTLDGDKKVGSYHRETRLFFPQELMFFLEQAGFNVLEAYSYDSLDKASLSYKQLDRRRVLIVAKK